MPQHHHTAGGFDGAVYEQSQARLRQLKATLPDKSVETIAREVIRLLSSHGPDASLDLMRQEALERFCHALLSEDDQAGARFITDLRAGGATIEVAYLTYLSGAARLLGQWWTDNRVTFTEVTLGTSRMYAIMRALRHQFADGPDLPSRSAVFTSVPGETHTLGVRMAADLFRKDGWDIDLKINKTHEEIIEEIRLERPIVIGISAGGTHAVAPLSRLVIALRICVPDAHVFISGNIVEEAKESVDLMGVDGIVTDVTDAKFLMSAVWDASGRDD